MQAPPERLIAVDWSGAKKGAERRIWLAEVTAAGLIRLERGRTRAEVTRHLLDEARADSRLAVGLDFAFSFPAWFLEQAGCASVEEFWRRADRQGDRWSSEVAAPFFDRGGWEDDRNRDYRRFSPYRKTELEQSPRPETVFKLVGQRQVGKSSLTGMRELRRLREGGFNVWPFHAAELPIVMEIYPRLFYGPRVRKSDVDSRRLFLEEVGSAVPPDLAELVTSSDDAFDAAISALALYRYRHRLVDLEREGDARYQLEGKIWTPQTQLTLGVGGGGLTARLSEALAIAVRRHGRETHRTTGAPRVAHLLATCALVLEHGGDENEAIAALLYAPGSEGAEEGELAAVGRRFGHRVEEILRSATGPESGGRGAGVPPEASLLVALAAAVDEACAVLTELERSGDRVWRRLGRGRAATVEGFRSFAASLDGVVEGRAEQLRRRLASAAEELAGGSASSA